MNNLPVMEYFPVGERYHALYPFIVAGVGGLFDVNMQVHGGGKMGRIVHPVVLLVHMGCRTSWSGEIRSESRT